MKFFAYSALSLFAALLLSGCATSNDALNIRMELRELRKEMSEFKKMQADIRMDLDTQNVYLQQLAGKVDASAANAGDDVLRTSSINEIAKRMYGIEEKLYRMWVSTAPLATALPDDMYATAKADYDRGNFDLAEIGFTRLVETYPDSPVVPLAQYELAQVYYAKSDWPRTIQEVNVFVNLFPNHERVPRALLIKARALTKKGEHVKAKRVLEAIRQSYPLSEEARVAHDELENLLLSRT
jgi:TolA-binding protein